MTATTAQWLSLAWQVTWGLGTLLALLITWWIKRWAAPRSELDDANERLTRIEERVSHLPTDDDLSSVRKAIADLDSKLSELVGESRVTTRVIERIDKFMMERDR